VLPPLEPSSREGPVPISCTQERLWLVARLRLVRRAGYDWPTEVRLSGRLDVAALLRALTEITARHQTLRTRFQMVSGVPHQLIDPPCPCALPTVDLSILDEQSRSIERRRICRHEARARFDLTRGPLLRLRLLRASEDEHVLLIKVHHVIFDGWSLAVLMRELSALYSAFSRGDAASPLPALPIQYADYSLWQRQLLQGERFERQLFYWKERLAGVKVLQLPTDRPRPRTPSFAGARLAVQFSKELTMALQSLARREGATLYMVLLAAFQLLLSHWSGQTDIAVGSPIAGRTHRKTETLIGFFLNIVVVRAELSADPTFLSLLAQVRKLALDAYAHQDLPFERLLVELGMEWDPSRHPIFQAQFVFQTTLPAVVDLPGLTTRVSIGARLTARYDLTLELTQEPEGLSGYLGYATDLFDARTIERCGRHFRALLEAVVVDPRRRISEIVIAENS
jgi:hypothetical protein